MSTIPTSDQPEEDASVLRDVLDELDRERSQRAELEAKVRSLIQGDDEKPASKKNGSISKIDYIALETEKEGLVELLDALLSDTPAFQAASNKTTSLPMHALRLLEIMPWDSRSRQHAIGKEELYEWQFYQTQWKQPQWVQHLRHFPQQFRNLPIIQPTETDVKKKGIFGDITYPPKHVVLTDAKLSYIVNIDKGYPLPDDGTTWQWISGWRIDRHVETTDKERSMDCDDQGWSYAAKPSDFSVRELCWDAASDEKSNVVRTYRRRRWVRRRVLVSYPNASQPTLEYLRLLAENMSLGVNVTKLNDQLVETKTALTETEATLLETKEEAKLEQERLKARIKKAEELLNELGLGQELEVDKKDSASLLLRADSLRKEQAEKINKIWRQSSWNGPNKDDENGAVDKAADKAADSDQRFDWKRIARGPFTPSRPSVRKASLDDSLISLDEPEDPFLKGESSNLE